jgi:hypothetical protein
VQTCGCLLIRTNNLNVDHRGTEMATSNRSARDKFLDVLGLMCGARKRIISGPLTNSRQLMNDTLW